MMPVPKLKVMGNMAHVIGIMLNVCVLGFVAYLATNARTVVGTIALDTFVGITGLMISGFGIYSLSKEHEICLAVTRNLCAATALFSALNTVLHTVIPFYRDFETDFYGVQNGFYLTATAFVLMFIQSIYSTYISHSLLKSVRLESARYSDVESLEPEKPSDSLNETARSMKKVLMV